MSTPNITTRPADMADPQGKWLVVVNGHAIGTRADKLHAERYADNLREQLLGELGNEPAWTPRHTRSALGLVLLIVLLAITGYCTQARAAEGFTVGLHLATAHFGGRDLRPSTPGLYGRVNAGPLQGLTGGTYLNSYGNRSHYVGWSGQTDDKRFAITLGAVTGYSAQRVMPLVAPSVRVPLWGAAALRVAYIPKPRKQGNAAGLHVSTELEF